MGLSQGKVALRGSLLDGGIAELAHHCSIQFFEAWDASFDVRLRGEIFERGVQLGREDDKALLVHQLARVHNLGGLVHRWRFGSWFG